MSKIFNFQFSIFNKFIFFWKKPKIIIITGSGRKTTAEAIFCLLSQYFKVAKIRERFPNILKKEVLIFETELKEQKEVEFLIKKSALPILLITHFGDIPPDKDFFAGERKDVIQLKKLAKILPVKSHLILNFEDETVREIGEETDLKEITFGFQEGADFRATDIKLNSGTNFKINYKGNIVPIWLEKIFGKEQIYSALAAAAVGIVFGLNLVEISNALKNYQFLSSNKGETIGEV